jgi:flagellin FlaB
VKKLNKKGSESGIGTLIIFIAMILVAAIAAGVLLRTATTLQNKALLTGMRSKDEVATALTPILVYGEDGSNHYIDFVYMKLKLIPGSEPIKFNNALLSINLNNQSAELNFREINESNNEVHNCTYTGNEVDSAFMTSGSRGNYSVKYILKGTANKDGYLNRGDVVTLCFQMPRPVFSDEDIKIEFSPKVGKSLVIETSVPEAALTKRVYIFP